MVPSVYARVARMLLWATGCILVCLFVRHWRRLPLPPDPWDGELGPGDGRDSDGRQDTAVLCTSCLARNGPAADFCAGCGNPIGDTTALDPLKRIYAQGWIYRRAASAPYRLLIVVGMWLIYLPLVLVMGPVAIVAAGTLFKVTRNYVRHRRRCRPA